MQPKAKSKVHKLFCSVEFSKGFVIDFVFPICDRIVQAMMSYYKIPSTLFKSDVQSPRCSA